MGKKKECTRLEKMSVLWFTTVISLCLSLLTHTHFSMMVDGGSLWILCSWTADGDDTQSCRAAMCDV